MRRFTPLTAVLLVALLLAPLAGEIGAQPPPDTAQNLSDRPSAVFIGARRVEGEAVGSFGFGRRLGGKVWLFSVNDFGAYASAGVEVAYLWRVVALNFGLIAGPNVDTVPVASEADPISYLVGAGGALLTYHLEKPAGVWAYYKRKISLGDQTEYDVSHNFGGGFYLLFGP